MADTKISLLCPTRGRPSYLIPHFESIIETARHPGRLELMFYVDRDDPELAAYEATFDLLREACGDSGPRIVAVIGDRMSVPRATNSLALASSGDIVMMSNDDLRFVTSGWDAEIDKAAAAFPDGIFNIFFNDGYFGERLSCFPIVGRRWVQTLGYLIPVVFEHFVGDQWVHHLGRFLKRNIYLEHVHIEHRHFDVGTGKRFVWEEPGPARRRMERDDAAFRIYERYMRLDYSLLKEVVAGNTPQYAMPEEAVTEWLKNL